MPTTRAGFDDSPQLTGRDALVLYGPTMYVEIGFDPGFTRGDGIRPNLPTRQHLALVDTGATTSCIDSTLAINLGLPIADRRPVSGVHGSSEVNLHIAQMHVPSLDITVVGLFAGVHLTAGGQPHFALIGRTFLRDFTMVYQGRTGTVTISNDLP